MCRQNKTKGLAECGGIYLVCTYNPSTEKAEGKRIVNSRSA